MWPPSGPGGTDETAGTDGGDGNGDGDGTPPGDACTPSIGLYDTSSPTAVIGTGTPDSCTGAALKAAAEQGGTITFDCGADPATIMLDETIVLPVDTDTIIDGEGRIALDGGSSVRHFLFDHPDWMNNPTKVVLQRLTLVNGSAPLGEYFPQDPDNPNCAYGYKDGAGGVVYMRNGVLHVVDSEFRNNVAALEGPDVAGGAIYVVGVPDVIVTGSVFRGNRAANGGAIGMLFATPQIYDSVFEDNTAVGIGQNYVEPGCPNFNHDEQGGASGNSGAIVFDGLNDEDTVYTICGSVFRNNRANELGGALFRTPNAGIRRLSIEASVFDGNTARMGGVSFIKDNEVTVRGSTFMNNRSGVDVDGNELGGPLGGLWVNQGSVDIENSTFYDNRPTALDVEGSGGTVTNTTFVQSRPAGVSIRNSLFVDTSCDAPLAGSTNVQWPEATACAEGTTFADPATRAPGDNGGPTPTVMPASASAVTGVGVECPRSINAASPGTPDRARRGQWSPRRTGGPRTLHGANNRGNTRVGVSEALFASLDSDTRPT